MSPTWTGNGPEYRLAWGGRTWTLDVAADRPGLRCGALGPLLALEGVAQTGRWDTAALSGATLVGFVCRFGRVEATYTPGDWSALTVRAAWSPSGADAVDLKVQVNTLSVGELPHLEVKLVSLWHSSYVHHAPTARWVEPRDAHSASLSYDGREPDLAGLTTLPPRESAFVIPRLVPDGNHLYVEMVHPEDVSRRIREGGPSLARSPTTRYGLFGYDLERGVVLRGRLRGIWLESETAKEDAFARMDHFLAEPPPLTT